MSYALKYKELRKNAGLSQAEFAILSGTSRSIVSQIEIGKLKPSLENIANIVKALKIPYSYFFEENVNLNVNPIVNLIDKKERLGVGSDLNEPTEGYSRKNNILLVPIKARAGYLAGYGDPEYIEKLEYYNIPGCHGDDYRIFEVEGDSMYPSLRTGDYVIGQRVMDCCKIKSGHIYIMVCRSEGIVIKRTINDPLTPGKLILNSDNFDKHAYPPIVLHGASILECWELHKIITGPPDPQDPLLIRFNNLEAEVIEIRRSLKRK